MPATVMLYLVLLSIGFLSTFTARAEESITVVSDLWPPFITADKNKPGIDVEAMKQAFKTIDVRVKFSILPWKRAHRMVEKGQADALLDAFNTPDRADTFWFPEEPMNKTETALFCFMCDTSRPINVSMFDQKRLVINRGYKYSRFGNDPKINRVAVNSFEQGFKMLDGLRADYYLVNRFVGLHTLTELGLQRIKVFEEGIEDPSPVYLAFHKSDDLSDMVKRFSQALAQFKTTDEYQKILVRYGIIPPR